MGYGLRGKLNPEYKRYQNEPAHLPQYLAPPFDCAQGKLPRTSPSSFRQRIFIPLGHNNREQIDLDYPNIIKQCLNGNRTAQKALFDQFSSKMLYLCRRYAIDDNEAHDMVQEGFIRLFGNLEKFRNTGPFEGWVRRIFVNTAIKYYHKERHHNTLAAMELATAFENEEPGIINALSEQELLGLLAELPDGYRVVFNLYAIEGYNHAEIAALLEIQESTSRSQLVKARKLLQTKVNDLQRVIL